MNINNRNINFLFFATLSLFFMGFYTSCEKLRKDYRDKWVGPYECEKYRNYDTQTVIVDVTAEFDSVLHIEERNLGEYGIGLKYNVQVNHNGDFERIYNDIGMERPIIKGNFCGDNLFINYHDYSPNRSIDVSYKGKKK